MRLESSIHLKLDMTTKQQFLNLFRDFSNMDDRTVLKLLANSGTGGYDTDALVAALYEAGYALPSRKAVADYRAAHLVKNEFTC